MKEKLENCENDKCCEGETYDEAMLELEDTYHYMVSTDYKERFKAEYYQTKIRYAKLKHLLNKWDAYLNAFNSNDNITLENWLGFKPKCSYNLLREQQTYMGQYLHILEIRAEIEHIALYI